MCIFGACGPHRRYFLVLCPSLDLSGPAKNEEQKTVKFVGQKRPQSNDFEGSNLVFGTDCLNLGLSARFVVGLNCRPSVVPSIFLRRPGLIVAIFWPFVGLLFLFSHDMDITKRRIFDRGHVLVRLMTIPGWRSHWISSGLEWVDCNWTALARGRATPKAII